MDIDLVPVNESAPEAKAPSLLMRVLQAKIYPCWPVCENLPSPSGNTCGAAVVTSAAGVAAGFWFVAATVGTTVALAPRISADWGGGVQFTSNPITHTNTIQRICGIQNIPLHNESQSISSLY